MGSLTWKHWTLGVITAVMVAALVVWLAALRGGSGDGDPPVIAEPNATATDDPSTDDPSPEPTDEATPSDPAVEPTPSETPGDASEGTWLVTTDGDDVVLRSDGGGDAVTLYDGPAGAETSVVHVAVQPGSTTRDLTVVFTRFGEGMYDLSYATIRDRGQPVVRSLPDQYQVMPDVDPGSHPFPVWSPDGRHLAWTEHTTEGEVVLRTIGWSDGPGTGEDADDNATFELDGLAGAPTTVEEWVWNGEGTATAGSLVVTTDELEAYRVDIERQADGALARPGQDGIREMVHPEGSIVDQADGRTGPTSDTSAIYTLIAGGGDQGTVDLRLEVVEGSDQGDELPVPQELERTSDPGSRWIVADGDTVLIGDGGGAAWVIGRNGRVRALTGTIVSGSLVG